MVRPGEWILSDQPVEINVGRRTCKIKVRNTGDRPIQIGSHYHFFEVNRALDFDRTQALGMHLNLPGGLAVRFEPGDEREVELVEYGGAKQVVGFNNLVNGGLNAESTIKQALRHAMDLGFPTVTDVNASTGTTQPRQHATHAGADDHAKPPKHDAKHQVKSERKS